MFILKVVLNGIGENLMLRYKFRDRAEAARSLLETLKRPEAEGGLPIEIADDFGVAVKIEPFSPKLAIMIDFEAASEGDVLFEIARQTIGNREVAKAQKQTIVPAAGVMAPNGRRMI